MRRRLLAPTLLAWLLLAPSALQAASSQGSHLAPDAIRSVLDDVGGAPGQAGEAQEELLPAGPGGAPSPQPGDPRERANATLGEARDAAQPLDGAIRVLFSEDFEGASLAELGWGQEVLRGSPPWGLVDAATGTVQRADGTRFTPQFATGESPIQVKDGHRAATVLNARGTYDPRVDARLVSPVIDLRFVRGASQRTDDPYDALTSDPTLGEPYRAALAAWRENLGGLGTQDVGTLDGSFGWLLRTPPTKIQRLYFGPAGEKAPGLCRTLGERGSPLTCGEPGDLFYNPLAERYGAGLVNLTFYHKYRLSGLGSEVPGALRDGVFLEARVVREDGSVGPWEHLFGDAVFEAQVNRNDTRVLFGNSPTVPVSGFAESAQGLAGEDSDYRLNSGFYNGRVRLRDPRECTGARVDCKPDAPAFVQDSRGLWKSHFTLNRFAGHKIQLAWRLHAGTAFVPEDLFGWFVDAVRVEALLPERDVGVHELARPRPGDLVPTSVELRPEVVVKNYGHKAVEAVRLNFTILEDRSEVTPASLRAAAQEDANQTQRALSGARPSLGRPPSVAPDGSVDQGEPPGVEPGAPLPPGGLAGQAGIASRQAEPPRAVLEANATLERIGPLEEVRVRSPLACEACGPGAYRLVVRVAPATLSGGEPGSLPFARAEDGTLANNNASVRFEVRDVAAATLRLRVPAAAVLTDLGEPKALRVELANLGNVELTGSVEVTARRLDLATLEAVPGEPAFPARLDQPLSVGPGDLPGSARLTSFGSPRAALALNANWNTTGLEPGAYRLEATFKASRALAAPALDRAIAFVRAVPPPYFAEDFEGPAPGREEFSPGLPAAAGWANQGWRPGPFALPRGAVSSSRTWNANAFDGAFLEASALALLAGRAAGLDQPFRIDQLGVGGRVTAAVRFGPEHVEACVGASAQGLLGPTCNSLSYDEAERRASDPGSPGTVNTGALGRLYARHSFLNDYFLTRRVHVPQDCGAGCELVFWHFGNLSWHGGLAAAPPGAPAQAQDALNKTSPEELGEERARGLVEVTLLDGNETAERGPETVVLWNTTEPVLEWRRERVGLAAFAGREVALAFHFQTTVGRLQTERPGRPACTLGQLAVNPLNPDANPLNPDPNLPRCFGNKIHEWVLDNIRLVKRSADGGEEAVFFDTVGDPDPESATAWREWASFRTLRDVADANVALHPSCFEAVRPAAVPPGSDTASAAGLAECLQRSNFRGPVVGFEGRGWSVFDHAAGLPSIEGTPNPYQDGWFVERGAGFQPPGAADGGKSHALRWGSPRGSLDEGAYPPANLYAIASSPLFSLARSARPFAELRTNYSFARDTAFENDDPSSSGALDGGIVFLARYRPAQAGEACERRGAERGCFVLDRRVVLAPERGYPGLLNVGGSDLQGELGTRWIDGGQGTAPALTGSNPLAPEWLGLRFNLLRGLEDLCLKAVTDAGATRVQSFGAPACKDLALTVDWDGPRGLAGGVAYLNLTSFDADAEALYALEFHAQNDFDRKRGVGFGWVVDDLRVGEEARANDLGVSRLVRPAAGQPVGPGQEVQLRVNVTNFGVFPQRGFLVHFNVTRQGVQVFPDPRDASKNPPQCSLRSCAQSVPRDVVVPGLRNVGQDRNVTLGLETPWVPAEPGIYEVQVWTELVGAFVDGRLVPLPDEDPLNDLLRQVVEVREVHSVRLAPPSEFPDEEAVVPLVGTAEQARAVRILVENLGTMTEGDPTGLEPERVLRLNLTIVDEVGREASLEAPVPPLRPGESALVDFGARAWLPGASGSFALRFRLKAPEDLLGEDNEREVRVTVLDAVLPREGQPWTAFFAPEGQGWSNETRPGFAEGQGWSFGRGDRYAPGEGGSLVLREPVDVTGFRDAVLVLEHRYDFEEGYDGGVVEVSDDGQAWHLVEPRGGYPGAFTSASPEAHVAGEGREGCRISLASPPERACKGFTGSSEGVVTSVVPLGSVNLTRTERLPLFRDTFEEEPFLAGAAPPEARGAWRELVARSEAPGGRAWWVNKSLAWRHQALGAVQEGSTTLEGWKELRLNRTFRLPKLDVPLVVEFEEWRALGLSTRGTKTVERRFHVPTSVEVRLEAVGPGGEVLASVPVLPRAATPDEPYADNYLDWTTRRIVVPSHLAERLQGKDVRLAFRMNLANSNDEEGEFSSPVNRGVGMGTPADTDLLSPHLGWAIAAPRITLLATPNECLDAALPFVGGRCVLFEDSLRYVDADDPDARATWSAAWRTELHARGQASKVLASDDVGGDAFAEAGWRLVEAAGLPAAARAWSVGALAPPRSGRGHVAEAIGSGIDARLVTPLDLRGVTGEAILSFDHSFKFTDLQHSVEPIPGQPELTYGAVSGGRVEVSTDGGRTWEPLAPLVEGAADDAAYTAALRDQGFRRTFALPRPQPSSICVLDTGDVCVDPEAPFEAPGRWRADGQPHPWSPQVARSAHTPLAGPLRDPERDSTFGIGSMAFAGGTCRFQGAEPKMEPCGGAEDWRPVRFNLSGFAGHEVLLGFRAWFTTHRFASEARLACPPGTQTCADDARILIPRDFWRIDNVTLEARVLDGKPLLVRLRAFSDGSGERHGWDVLNVSLLGTRHVRNVGARVLEPAPGAPLLLGNATARAIVVNKGQEGLAARALLVVEQLGEAVLRNGGFEDFADNKPDAWNLTGSAKASQSDLPAEGAAALRLEVDADSADPFRLTQQVLVPPGRWRLVGLADVENRSAGPNGRVLVAVENATGDGGEEGPSLALPERPKGGDSPTAGETRYAPFALNFTVEGAPRLVEVVVHARSPGCRGASEPPCFRGRATLDGFRIEPRAPPLAAPEHDALRNPGFEEGLLGWNVSGKWRILNATQPGLDLGFDNTGANAKKAAMPEGRHALALEATGFGPRDAEVVQSLRLEPGAYRFSGILATRGVTWNLTRSENATDSVALPTGGGTFDTVQTILASDLPRNVTALRLWTKTGQTTLTVRLLDEHGLQLGEFRGLVDEDGGVIEPTDTVRKWVHVPLGIEQVQLAIQNPATATSLQVHDDGDYPNGTLLQRSADGDLKPQGKDLRVEFLGPVNATGDATLVVGRGPSEAWRATFPVKPAQPATENRILGSGDASLNLTLDLSAHRNMTKLEFTVSVTGNGPRLARESVTVRLLAPNGTEVAKETKVLVGATSPDPQNPTAFLSQNTTTFTFARDLCTVPEPTGEAGSPDEALAAAPPPCTLGSGVWIVNVTIEDEGSAEGLPGTHLEEHTLKATAMPLAYSAMAESTFDLVLPPTAAYPLRQVVQVENLPVRRVVGVAVKVELPAAKTLRQGELRAQLFNVSGAAISEEAVFPVHDSGADLAPEVRVAKLNFTNAVIPPGTERILVGVRAVNLTVRLPAVLDASADPKENGFLAWRGLAVAPEATEASDGSTRLRCAKRSLTSGSADTVGPGCDLTLNITYLREGALVIDAEGAQGAPRVLVEPTGERAILTANRNGGLAFAYDFLVAPGAQKVALRVRADQWQGEAILDALRLAPLSQRGAEASASLKPGEAAELKVPIDSVPGARYAVRVEAAAGDGAGERLLGDNQARVATGQALGPGTLEIARLAAEPNSYNLTSLRPLKLKLTLRNPGSEEVQILEARGVVESLKGETVRAFTQVEFEEITEGFVVRPLEARTFTWSFEPSPALAHGMYRVRAEVQALAPEGRFTIQGTAPLYIGSDFNAQFGNYTPFVSTGEAERLEEFVERAESLDNAWRWTSDAVLDVNHPTPCKPPEEGRSPPNPCKPGGQQGEPKFLSEQLNWMFRRTEPSLGLNLSPPRSLTLGGDPERKPTWPRGSGGSNQDGGSAPYAAGTIFVALRSPATPIPHQERPRLIYAERHELGGAQGKIFARLVNLTSGKVWPEGECLAHVAGARTWFLAQDGIAGKSVGFGAKKWVTRNVDLAPLVEAARSAGHARESFTHVQVCWRLEQLGPRSGGQLLEEWSVDDVLVTPYAMEMGPAQRVPIGDDVVKDFRVLLRNTGAFTDAYEVRFEDEAGIASRGPSNWALGFVDDAGRVVPALSHVEVEPGQERVLTVRVRVDTAPPTLAREGSTEIALTAISKTTSLVRATLRLAFDFRYPERPNLRIAGIIVNDPNLSVDKPRTVDVLVQNTGSVPVSRAELAVLDKMDPSFGVPPEELRLVDGSPIPRFDLAPGELRVVTVNWVPRVPGEHNVTAIVDPLNRVLEFDEADNVLARPILVPKAEFPDLLVEASVSNLNPLPGDLVEIRARVTNKGGAAAEGVQVSVRAGVTDLLPGEPPHVLPKGIAPGESVSLNASWRPAFPGEQVVVVRAKTFAGILERLDTSGDNVALLAVRVRSRGLEVVPPEGLAAQPGETARGLLVVRNRGDIDDTYVLRAEPPEGWRVGLAGLGEEARVSVGNRSAATLAFEATPPIEAEAGPHAIVLRASSENGTERVEASVVVAVPQGFGLRLRVEPHVELAPGARSLGAELENTGNGPDSVTVRARSLPEGWGLEPGTFLVPARGKLAVRLNLTIPGTTPEGPYEAVVEAQGRGGGLVSQRSVVAVLPQERLVLRLDGLPEAALPGEALEGTLVVRNEGNVPARANLSLAGPEGWLARLERSVASMEPGEERVLGVRVTLPVNASAGLHRLEASALSGRGERYGLAQPLRAARADLALEEAELLPRGNVRDGAIATLVARVVNRGDASAATSLGVYLDDNLVALEPLPPLEPGASVRINASFRARGGEHVVLAAVDPGQGVGEDDEANNARVLVQRAEGAAGVFAVPGPGAWPALAAAAAVALILRKRKVEYR